MIVQTGGREGEFCSKPLSCKWHVPMRNSFVWPWGSSSSSNNNETKKNSKPHYTKKYLRSSYIGSRPLLVCFGVGVCVCAPDWQFIYFVFLLLHFIHTYIPAWIACLFSFSFLNPFPWIVPSHGLPGCLVDLYSSSSSKQSWEWWRLLPICSIVGTDTDDRDPFVLRYIIVTGSWHPWEIRPPFRCCLMYFLLVEFVVMCPSSSLPRRCCRIQSPGVRESTITSCQEVIPPIGSILSRRGGDLFHISENAT